LLKEIVHAQERILPDCELVIPPATETWANDRAILALAPRVEVIISAKPPNEIVKVAGKLRMIQTIGTGFEADINTFSNRGVVVCNSVGMNAFAVAEHTMALLLTLAKNISQYDNELRRSGWWKATKVPVVLLRNKTLGIVGLGSIGTELVKRVKPFGMRVIAIKKHPSAELRTSLGIDFLGGPTDLPRIMKESDFIILSQTSTPETKRMIGENELKMMKKSAYLINVSRGAVVDEKALIKILKEKAIRGAGLDVFEAEPMNPENPLLKMDNVVLTPHMAGGAEAVENALRLGREDDLELLKERADFLIRNIERFLKGEQPLNIINSKLAT